MSSVSDISLETKSFIMEEESEAEILNKQKAILNVCNKYNIDFPQKQMPSSEKQFYNARIVLWKDLNIKECEKLLDAPTLFDVRDILAEIFSLTDYDEDLQKEILLNLYAYNIQFAKENGFKIKQVSGFFSIVKCVHEFCTESAFVKLDDTFDYFEDLLICHCILHPPFKIELFSVSEATKIGYYMVDTYFRHFKLYKYAFTPKVLLDLVLNYAGESKITDDQDSMEKNGSEIEGTEEGSLSVEPEVLAVYSEKERARVYLRNMITEFLKRKITEIKLSVQGKLESCEKLVNTKLEDAGYKKGRYRPGKAGKKTAHNTSK